MYKGDFTHTGPADQRWGRDSARGRAVNVTRVLHQKRRLFLQAAGDSNVINTQKPTAGERDTPRGVERKHTEETSEQSMYVQIRLELQWFDTSMIQWHYS